MQPVYSVEDDLATGGNTLGVGSKATLAPAQPGGPFATVNLLGQSRLGHLDRLLPLPCIYFDGGEKKLEMREPDLLRYYNRLVAPLRRTALLPQMMRQVADILDRAVEGKKRS